MKVIFVFRDLAIDFLNVVKDCEDEIWMFCARYSDSTSVIEKIHQLVTISYIIGN